MARTGKIGIDYWSHDSDMFSDTKIRILTAKHGVAGYGFFNLLLDRIYGENGYYLQLSEDFNILFSNDCKLDLDVYILMLNDCIEKGLFNSNLHKRYGILTSRRIQKTYCDACQRRKEVFFFKEFLLLKPLDEFPERVNVHINSLNADIDGENVGINLQKKRKEKRVKEKDKKYTDDAYRVAEYLLSQIETHMPEHKKWNIESWAKDIDLAIRIDKRTPRELCELAKWIHVEDQSRFDRPNVLSGKKLRDRFDQINSKKNTKPAANKNEWSMENRKML